MVLQDVPASQLQPTWLVYHPEGVEMSSRVANIDNSAVAKTAEVGSLGVAYVLDGVARLSRDCDLCASVPGVLLPARRALPDVLWAADRLARSACIMLFPSTKGRTYKKGKQDNRVSLETALLSFLPEVLREHLRMKANAWNFTYQGLYAVLKKSVATVCSGRLEPFQLRQGASIDAYGQCHGREKIRCRGRWRTLTRVARYEKFGRLELTWNQFGATKRAFMEACQLHLKGTLRGLSDPVLRE